MARVAWSASPRLNFVRWMRQTCVHYKLSMADVFSKAKRKYVMSQIKSSGNAKTEKVLIRIFKELGIKGWRRHQHLVGHPDFVFRRHRVAVFVDGCFWHCCPIHQTWPKNNARFWREKLTANRVRDQRVTQTLKQQKWRVLRIWEHELNVKSRRTLFAKLRRYFPNQKKNKGAHTITRENTRPRSD